MLKVITIHGYSVQSYHLMAALAALVGICLSFLELKKYKLGIWRWGLPVLMGAAALAGARIWNYLVNPAQFGQSFPVWQLHYSGLSLYGGLLGALLVLACFSKRKKQALCCLLDAFVVPGGVSVILLKIGCFLNGCCFGKRTNSAFGLEFPASVETADFLNKLPLIGNIGAKVHPTQLYEAVLVTVCLLAVMAIRKKRKLPEGAAALLSALLLSAVRLLVHFFRAYVYAPWVIFCFYPAVYMGIILICAAALQGINKKGVPKSS